MGFSHSLIDWYEQNRRDLPWRYSSDPYEIWVSEVILQQTRVAQGLGYYLKFIGAFPSVTALAEADIDRVLKVWQGLGYYTRARNMHSTAKYIVDKLGGVFPNSYSELIKLKGVGDYTAAAIAAFAFKEPVAAVDGNVYRIFARIFGVETPIDTTKGKKELKEIATNMLDIGRPHIYNQAIMDFGGTLCMPKNPKCYECPVLEMCSAFRNRMVADLPRKSKKVKQSVRFFTYIIPEIEGMTFISKRTKSDIWHSLYEFPLIESEQQLTIEELVRREEWLLLFNNAQPEVVHVSSPVKYILSHQKIFAQFVVVRVETASELLKNRFFMINFEDIHSYSTSRLIEGYLVAEPVEKYFRRTE